MTTYDPDARKGKTGRISILAAVMAAVMAIFTFRLMELQLVKGSDFRSQVDSTFTSKTAVSAARGEIVDRYGRALATNRTAYNVIFYRVFMPSDQTNQIILDLIGLMQRRQEEWIDNLPLTRSAENLAFEEKSENASANIKKYLGLNNYATAQNVLDELQKKYKIDENFTPDQVRAVAGVRYEMERTGYSYTTNYTFAQDISADTLSEIKESNYLFPGVDIEQKPIREYVSGTVLPHVIGTIGPIYAEEYEKLKEQGYPLNATVGKSGLELTYEQQLRGVDGVRTVVKDKKGNILSDNVEKDPVPGGVVRLTIDKNFQQFVQQTLEKEIKRIKETMKYADQTKGGAVVVLDTRTFEVLAMATYPNYDINDYLKDYNTVATQPLGPLVNRATYGLYRPGSVFKPVVANKALGTGLVSTSDTVVCNGIYDFYAPSYTPWCMNQTRHGAINVTRALSVSCNIYFYDVGRRLMIDKIRQSAEAFGFGKPTGIECGEYIGQVAGPELKEKKGEPWYPGDTLQAAIGQQDTLATPLQLAVYTATLAGKGERLKAGIVSEVSSFDYSQTFYKNTKQVLSTVDTSNRSLEVVREGMVTAGKSGSAQSIFRNYPISVAAKTGSPQTTTAASDGSFITYAPADNPEIAIAIIGENVTHGWYLGNMAKEIYDYYFFTQTENEGVKSDGQLLS